MELVFLLLTFFINIHIQKSMAIESIHKTNDHESRDMLASNSHAILDSPSTAALPLVKVDFDSPLFLHDKLELECRIHLRSDQVLYSVKWYKDQKEFFVYLPRENRATRFYPIRGVHFDTPSYSHINQSLYVWLRNINLDSQGIYQCEVSTDAPEFAIYRNEKPFEVLVIPSRSPRISGSRSNFAIKNRVDLNCTVPRSRPLPTLQWLINDQPAPGEYLIHYPRTNHSDGLSSKTLRIRFIVTEQYYQKGNMQLKCVATYRKLQSQGGVTRRHSKLNQQQFPALTILTRQNESNKLNVASSNNSRLTFMNSYTYSLIVILSMMVYMTTQT